MKNMMPVATVVAMLCGFGAASETRADSFRTGSRFSPTCKYSHVLTSPWRALELPIAGGRVCNSTSSRAEVQYVTKHKSHYETSYDEALTAAGYVKDRCSDLSCTYKNGSDKVTVQVIETRNWVTVIARK